MYHIDEKFKDASPVETVQRVQEILNREGLVVKEKWTNSGVEMCHSLRLTVEGTSFGCNGKGVSKELARASAYGEMMERLQTGFGLGSYSLTYSDAKEFAKSEIQENCGEIVEQIKKELGALCPYDLTSEIIEEKIYNTRGNKETVTMVPFWDVINKTKKYLPEKFIRRTCGSNGMAAGNSMAEALVQGFSEILERYSRTRIVAQKLTPPIIPEEYLRNFSVAYQIIQQTREAGYDVEVRDCSLGEGFPVIACIFFDKKKHTYYVNIGASPVFEIALQRTLTETFQGNNIKSITCNGNVLGDKSGKIDLNNLTNSFLSSKSLYPIEFFGKEPSYPFVPFKDKSGVTNDVLLQDIICFVKKKGFKMYIRDMSCLGFDAYRIYIPGVSEVIYADFVSKLPIYRTINTAQSISSNIGEATLDQLFELQMLMKHKKSLMRESFAKITGFSIVRKSAADSFLYFITLAYIAWEMNSLDEAYKHTVSAQKFALNNEDADYLSCLGKLVQFLSFGRSMDEVLNILSRLYTDEIIAELFEVLDNKMNPYKKLLLACEQKNCSVCKYCDYCNEKKNKEVFDKLNHHAMSFDNEKAFEKIRNTLG